MNKLLLSLLLASATTATATAQNLDLVSSQRTIASKADSYTNGYAQLVGGEKITYGNSWNNKVDAIITRASDKLPVMKWRSEPVKGIMDGYANFIHVIGVDQANKEEIFTLTIDGKTVVNFKNFHEENYVKESKSGVVLAFDRINDKGYGDGFYFMTIKVPENLVKVGSATEFAIDGKDADSNAWFMVFKNENLLAEIATRAVYDESYLVSRDKVSGDVRMTAPVHFIGKEVEVKSDDKSEKVKFTALGNRAVASVKGFGADFTVCDNKTTILDIKGTTADTTILNGYVLTEIKAENTPQVSDYTIKRRYTPSIDNIKALSQSIYGDSKVYIMVSSHQDIAWVDDPYTCVELRDKMIVSPALELLEKYPEYRYDIEDALILEEYLERHPDKRGLIEKLIKEGRLALGASYTQPYEEMQTGEALARQMYFGKRWVDKDFEGSNARTYWNVDVPGRTLQMPQILAKCGVQYHQYSRHEKGLFRWCSPDSSSIIAHTPGHYTLAAGFLRKTPEEGIEGFNDYINELPDYRSDKTKPAVIGMLSAEDMSVAHTYFSWIDKFKSYQDTISGNLPEVMHSTSDMFMDAFMAQKPNLKAITGERPDMWLYIHGPAHEKAITSYRKANRQATAAETFATVEGLVKGDFSDYPKTELDKMWKDIIYADHGWGGKDGNITDSLFRARYENAERESAKLVKKSTEFLASNVDVNKKLGTPVVVFNQLSYSYSSPVQVEVDMPAMGFALLNSDGEAQPYQVVEKNGSRATIEFIAYDMPSVGYQTYYINSKPAKRAFAKKDALNSDFYKVDMKDGKLSQIYDKELGANLFDTSKFGIGEIFTVESEGNGAGEFFTMQLTSMEGFESTTSHNSTWDLVQNGDVYALYCSKSKFADADIVRYMKIYKDIKRIDFPSEVNNFNGKVYREFRQTFPLVSKGEVSYEVPFGTTTVGKDEIEGAAGWQYQDICKDIHPRAINNWFGAKCGDIDVKVSSSVTVVDYIDPTENPVQNTVLQPILFASRKSCHWEGEFYYQEGDHSFNFTLNSTTSDDKLSEIKAAAANYAPYAVYDPRTFTNANLAESGSFFSVDNDGIPVSTIKKCEDDDQVVVRLYDAISQGGVEVNISSMFDIDSVQQTDMLELNGKNISGKTAMIGNRSIETFKLDVK